MFDKNTMIIEKIVAWGCTTIGILCGLYLTKSANCLWAFWIPLIYTTM